MPEASFAIEGKDLQTPIGIDSGFQLGICAHLISRWVSHQSPGVPVTIGSDLSGVPEGPLGIESKDFQVPIDGLRHMGHPIRAPSRKSAYRGPVRPCHTCLLSLYHL